MQIWPAIDIRNGKCVRLSRGDSGSETVYGESPADMANRWVAEGASGLHIVDLDFTRDGSTGNFDSILEIVDQVDVPLQMGGRNYDEDSIQKFLSAGIKRIVIDTSSLTDLEWADKVFQTYPDHLLLGLVAEQGVVQTNDGLFKSSPANSDSRKPLPSVFQFVSQIASYQIPGIVYTSGPLGDPSFSAIETLRSSLSVPLIASGGVSCTADVYRLAALGLQGCVIGKAFYEGRLTVNEALRISAVGASPL